jgi:Glycosyltransferase family 92
MKKFTSLCFLLILISYTSLFSEQQKPHEAYRYYLSAVAIFRDEADYLKEWIEYHKLLGIEHFYLYNNLSEDHYQTVLQPYIDNGDVDLIEWPYENGPGNPWSKIQKKSYHDAVEKCIDDTKWLAILDTDEFFVPNQHDTIASLIASEEVKKKNKRVAGYEISWILFGTSGVEKVPSDKLMIELLTLNEGKVNVMGKSIVRPQYVGSYINPHKTSLTHKMKNRKLPITTAQVNHYIIRDQYFLHEVKIPRVARYCDKTDYLLRLDKECCHNNPYSDKILRFVPELKKRMGF